MRILSGPETETTMLRDLTADSSKAPAQESGYRPLTAYFRDLSEVNVMTKDEETAAALKIGELRKGLWVALLNYPPFVEPICALMRQRLGVDVCPAAAVNALEQTSRTLRDRDLRCHHDAFQASRDELAKAMLAADVDSELADAILADLTSLEGDRKAEISLAVNPPRRGSVPFARYTAEVRKQHAALMAAKNAFVRANLRLVVALARRFHRGNVPLQDLIQEGNLGLMKAVDRFDPARGCRFSTYGSWWIRHAISRSIADKARSVRLPVHMIDACNKVTKARREFEAREGREPTDQELSAVSGVSVERIARMGWSLIETPLSLALPASRDGEASLVDTVADPDNESASDVLDRELLHEKLQEVFAQLSPLEADILRKRVGLDGEEEMTLKEIGAGYSLSRERIRQLQEGALAKLRAEFSRRHLM
ncbi:sigma-70 family RNA polymerase sigma factor [Nannocystis sp. ILAH1]|uniref:sigma-70 family RNA polymerase sigma factor n=1 Tax=unclassified Nannocystis TaxID=2627009 RepID=UPI002270644A|nr:MULTISPECIES: sigma-70 family RNA polymerase sigma factor [unclassified Nannocystis]MCY0987243.1 sigma-70 family RNA polymerase sigma factor [Nannocystis sp. ILAH1]MCY1070958.1 sigma-70 family RNA polymerase sigma factor [Nannocystis sp. RBIL2]